MKYYILYHLYKPHMNSNLLQLLNINTNYACYCKMYVLILFLSVLNI